MSLENIWLFLAITIGAAGIVRLAPIVQQRFRVVASLAVLLGFLCWAPFVLDDFRTPELSNIAVWVIAAMGLNILTGYNGQISLGHGALVALGAYTCAVLTDSTEQMSFVDANPWPFWIGIIAGGIVTATIGLLVGIPALRLSGPYLAIATLALAISFPFVMKKYDGFTGGSAGLRVTPLQPPDFLDGRIDRIEWLYFLSLFTAIVMLLLAWALLRGPLGRSFVAVRDSEVAAEAMGINIARTKVTAFTISAFYAGIAGGLYLQLVSLISPESINILHSINIFAAMVVGGLASIAGSVVAGAAFIMLPLDAPGLVGKVPGLDVDVVEDAPGAIQGVLVILTILLLPSGVGGFLQRIEHLRPAAIAEGLRAAPGQVLDRLSEARARARSLRSPSLRPTHGPGNPETPKQGK